ncbi:PEP/pyruvate-binding domain-containing protein [Actinoplanes sp. NPDC089786]|uniref:PEP/pyruvate-binding domain-containing protein n=1 Tax=Actinoplanes sp. NPDC089786 TaxID=3155185 RepID=UPI0034193A92
MIARLEAGLDASAEVIGGKAVGLVRLLRLGLAVPDGFVVGTADCREYLATGRRPDGLDEAAAVLGGGAGSAGGGAVSVRSGAAVSMPGMMSTLLDVRPPLGDAVAAVFESWNTPRAITYRRLHDIADEAGTAVIVQAMVYGDRDGRSGSGVAFSRDPNTGDPGPYGEFLPGRRGDAVVAGEERTLPVGELASRLPDVWASLRAALERVERHYRDVCHVEFTVESGRLWLLQVRPGGVAGHAAARVAVDLAEEGLITRAEAVARVDLDRLPRVPRLPAEVPPLARGLGASPGVATGRVATTADAAVRMTGPVILVRPTTSPLDLHGLAAAAGVVTARGGPASHAAVVARSMGKPAVVGAPLEALAEGTVITVDGSTGVVAAGEHPPRIPGADPAETRLRAWATGL